MRRLVGLSVLAAALALSQTLFAQSPSDPDDPNSSETRAATTTVSGTTGLWFLPSAETLPSKKWSASFYRTNLDDGQGFSDISTFPATFAVGLGGAAEVFGSWTLLTRIDRDTRPLFFPASAENGTGGGILVDYPFVRSGWFGTKAGDLRLGGKVNLLGGSKKPLAIGVSALVKLPVGDEESGASSGETDFQIDGIVSGYTRSVDLTGTAGVIIRGNPDGYTLTNGLRWGFGAGFPTAGRKLLISAELFGENYFDKIITAPAGQVGEDGSIVPVSTTLKNPVVVSLGLTWRARNGFFIGAAGSLNLTMDGREDAACLGCPTFEDDGDDNMGLQVRIGFHPGARNRTYVPPPPPAPPPPPPPPPPPAPAAANRPPTVTAACDPCTVEVGRTATITANAQDPDGDALTYQWTVTAGTVTNPTMRQSPWTAPNQPGPVTATVRVSDGRGGTAQATTTLQVTQPARREYSFEDVHFEFDRYTLLPDALRLLDEAITAMQADPTLRLQIEGHTDNIGTNEYNLALGERRSNSVRDYLVSRGIAANRLSTVSYGEERPKFDNSREEGGRRLNRRAVLVVRLQ